MNLPVGLVKCDPDNSFVICPERKAAMVAGDFFYDFARDGWVHLHGAARTPLGDRGRYFNEGPLPAMLITEICPFCGGGLPSLSRASSDSG